MTVRTAVLPTVLLVLLPLLAQDAPSRPRADEKNSAAEEIERMAVALGVAPGSAEGLDPASKEDLDAYREAAPGSWLDSQLRAADDSIAPPPAKLKEYLERRQAPITSLASVLVRDVPEWTFDREDDAGRSRWVALETRLMRLLLAAALVEERAADHGQASILLEASWSLYQSAASNPELISQLVATALAKLQAGVLRKIREPSNQWLDRMAGDGPRERVLRSLESDFRWADDDARKARVRAMAAVTDRLRKSSPCEVARLSEEEIWKPGHEEIERWIESGGDPQYRLILGIALPNLTGTIRRAGGLLVDRELTLKILSLRLEKAASRDGAWPETLVSAESQVCPGATYGYQAKGPAMAIRFQGSIDEPASEGALSLPLSFEVRAPRPTPTPTKPPAPRPTGIPAKRS